MNSPTYWLAGCAIMSPGLVAPSPAQAEGLYIAQADHVMGTSFDLKIVASSYPAAVRAETLVRAEIERLSQVLSSYQPDSEFNSWLATTNKAVAVSDDLFAVLAGFEKWGQQTGGAINAAAEGINQLWQKAAGSGSVPSETDRLQAVADARQQHWQLDIENHTADHQTTTPLRLNTFTKSYILDRAANAALALPEVSAVVLNSGGDLVVRGNWTETVAVANPRADAENSQAIARLAVQNRAVATSGDYRRGVQIGTDWYSHIVNPLTGFPANEVSSATVIHPDAVTAGALATAFNILSPVQSEQLAATIPDADYLIMTQTGQSITSPGWADLLAPSPSLTSNSSLSETARLLSVTPLKDKLWKADQELLINFELSQMEGRYHRPFVAVWVEDENHQPVRNLALWYNKPRWLPELRAFYALPRSNDVNVGSVTSATRSPGAYTLQWDGKDNAGQYVKQGKYTVCIEAAREHGTYQLMRQEMDFNGKTKQQTLNGNVEIASAALDYRQKSDAR
ncbi:DUF2271 domain-containing protein [Spirosoma pollinicola]|uniref:FAD:protein FMN transferase n=1 Tax=Spirosoma pollinicola TaxID=2057025 RepID=A0A2K8Z325_9BACT|nr:DUF2271 domain-containing protein [Spirosoma pollinicola]AUD04278.1 DUF2271 domain-containing protein [Spirosoma pollinicola]